MNNRLTRLLDSMGILIDSATPVSGGDINDSFRIRTARGEDRFVKLNKPGQSKEIIRSEYLGLEMMRKARVEILPSEVRFGESEEDACLVMPFYTRTTGRDRSDWVRFFDQLADMHLVTSEVFGGQDNFIGLLPQDNSTRNNWMPFFRDNRLMPQIRRAKDAGYFTSREMDLSESLLEKLSEFMPVERPALIHGDLWSGNILHAREGILLIDPCPHFGHREMDFAMMELFSGVPVQEYLPVYQNSYPLENGLYERIEIYQLYYLLVHLNLFGTAYLPGVQRIMKKFS